MFKYDVYLAGPFFNDVQKARMDLAKSYLVEAGLRVADPRELGPVIVDTSEGAKTPKFFSDIFDGNIEGMEQSFMIVASIDDKDTGTAFEMGWGYGSGKLMMSFAFEGGKTNVMLGQAVDHHFKSKEEFRDFFRIYQDLIRSGDALKLLHEANFSDFGRKAEANE
jgi:nucleoside 2-deoxyribosyltransferase